MVQTSIPLVLSSHPLQPFLHVTWVPRDLQNCFPGDSILDLDQVGYLYPPSPLPLWYHQSPVRSASDYPPQPLLLSHLHPIWTHCHPGQRQGTTSSASSHVMEPDPKFCLRNSSQPSSLPARLSPITPSAPIWDCLESKPRAPTRASALRLRI